MSGYASAAGARTDDPDRRLLIRGGSEISRYELTVDGDLEVAGDAADDAAERISGHSAEGVVKGGSRKYRFSGEIRDLNVDGDAVVYVRRGRDEPQVRLTQSGEETTAASVR
jgi:hypothetical protein